ncbi:hypothetical protein FIBSPDRAFT_135761 [Athelia psychrophila]|uniref:Uncharacterized protein n=1 Tax=Athelia psychrophila TaxID=1759441 RepID=A0A166C6Z5_9AGAM|nr:hypothetical protein FIBSPDRAFT_135761 [Fibularhizoctonia sp. CBS 109695]
MQVDCLTNLTLVFPGLVTRPFYPTGESYTCKPVYQSGVLDGAPSGTTKSSTLPTGLRRASQSTRSPSARGASLDRDSN